jgi:hypothetical protein
MTSTECLESFDYSVKPEIVGVFLTYTVSYNILFNDIWHNNVMLLHIY